MQNKIRTMENFKVISGEFNAKEANEILLHIVDNKIKFHNLKIFSSEERFGAKDQSSVKRLVELTNMRRDLKLFLEEALEQGSQLRVSANISIETVKEPKLTTV